MVTEKDGKENEYYWLTCDEKYEKWTVRVVCVSIAFWLDYVRA